MTRRIIIEAVSASEQRYDTLGDWFWNDDGELIIRVTTGDGDVMAAEPFLIALHELVEAALCKAREISQATVDDWDTAYDGDGEPGDEPGAPYGREHRFAMIIEHLVAHELGLGDYGRVE